MMPLGSKPLLLATLMFACVPAETNLEGRPCPCVDGYVCDLATETCTRLVDGGGGVDVEGDEDAPLADSAGGDVGTDSGGFDAGADAGPDDAGLDAMGPGDAGPSDVGRDAPDVPGTFCERHGMGTYRCLDFETDIAMEGWSVITSDPESTLNIDATRAVTGSSLRVTTGMGGSAYLEQIVPAVDSGTFWYRAQVFVGDPTAVTFWPFMAVGGLGEENDHYTYASLNGAQRVFVSHRKGNVENAEATTVDYAIGAWFCLEVSVDVQAGGEVELYLDGELVVLGDVDGSGSWRRLNVGSVGSDSGQPFRTIWMDDFVFSPTRVPCDLE